MPLKFFNAETTPNLRKATKPPDIAISYKGGGFRINRPMCEFLGIAQEDQLEFAQDEENEQNWYVAKVKEKGFELKERKSTSGGLVFNNTSLAHTMLKSAKIPDGAPGKIIVTAKPLKLQGMLLYPLKVMPLKQK
jgi:hypothetical protein